MKEKTKKIMAGVGIGLALAGSGMLMTGCTNVLSQTQMDKIMTVVDNSDKFMEETLDLLQENNRILDSKQAMKLYEYSMNKLHLNKDNVWNNLKISFKYDGTDGKHNYETHYFKLANGNNVLYNIDEGEVSGYISSETSKEKFNESAYKSCTGMIEGMYSLFSEDEIVDVEIAENGNYRLIVSTTSFMNMQDTEAIITIEITQDGDLQTVLYNAIAKMGNFGYAIQNVFGKYEYNVLSETQVQANIDDYNDQN